MQHPGLTPSTLHRAPVGQRPPGPDWLATALGFWSGRALATGTAWAGLSLIHHNSSWRWPRSKTPNRPLLPHHHRRVARSGLAMDNLESGWGFAQSSLALAATRGHVALRICAVDLKNAPQTAEALDKIKQCLAAAQISVEVADIKIKPLRAGSKSTLQDIFVVATLLPKASKMLRLLCDGPPGAYIHLFDLKEIGGIPSKGAYEPRSKVAKLPFNGAKFATMALVRSALCVTETHGAERAAHMRIRC